MVSTYIQMEDPIKDSGIKVNNMVKAYLYPHKDKKGEELGKTGRG